MAAVFCYTKSMGVHFHENIYRSITKAFTFRVLVMLADSVIIYALTHRYDLTLGVIILSNLSSTLIYFFHERVWNHVYWGKEKNGKK